MTDLSEKFLAVLKICSHLCIQYTCLCFAFLNEINIYLSLNYKNVKSINCIKS